MPTLATTRRRLARAMPVFRRAVVAVGTTLTLASASACGDDDPSGPSTDMRGTYTLRSVNGTAVPATLLNTGSSKFEVTGGALELKAQSEFEARVETRTTVGTEVETETDEAEGTWGMSGNQIVLTSDGETITGSVSGDSITITDNATIGIPVVLVFRK